MKWFKRSLLLLAALIIVAILIPLVSFMIWNQGTKQELESNSQVVRTSLGAIEYSSKGEGTPFLYLHGRPGGYDQSLANWKVYPELYESQQLIAVSRPGYLRTPLESGPTFEEQADLFAALLDELNIKKVVVYAGSGGSYPGIQFALRHPERTLALVLYAPSLGYEPLPENPGGSAGFFIDFANWVVAEYFMQALGPRLFSGFDPTNSKMLDSAKLLAQGVLPTRDRHAGAVNDVIQRSFPEIDDWSLNEITAPTLILHGNEDENSDYQKSADLARQIFNSELVTYEGGDHYLIITKAEEIRTEINSFVAKVLAQQGE